MLLFITQLLTLLIFSDTTFSTYDNDNRFIHQNDTILTPFIGDNIKIDKEVLEVFNTFFDSVIDQQPTPDEAVQLFKLYYKINIERYTDNELSWQIYINSIGAETSIDNFYKLYAYYLNKYTSIKIQSRREKLFKSYTSINQFAARLQLSGGSYYGHMYDRLYASVEYDLFRFNYTETIDYPFEKLKTSFITSLRIMAEDRIKKTDYIHKNGKAEVLKELYLLINTIDQNINEYFTLTMTKRFLNNNYNFIYSY